MSWWQILPLAVLAGLICGGFFLALGKWLDWREARRWDTELNEPRNIVIPQQRKSGESDGE